MSAPSFLIRQIKRKPHGVREVTCIVDGRKVSPFDIYPDALELYKDEKEFVAYLERSARLCLNEFGDAHGRRVA